MLTQIYTSVIYTVIKVEIDAFNKIIKWSSINIIVFIISLRMATVILLVNQCHLTWTTKLKYNTLYNNNNCQFQLNFPIIWMMFLNSRKKMWTRKILNDMQQYNHCTSTQMSSSWYPYWIYRLELTFRGCSSLIKIWIYCPIELDKSSWCVLGFWNKYLVGSSLIGHLKIWPDVTPYRMSYMLVYG